MLRSNCDLTASQKWTSHLTHGPNDDEDPITVTSEEKPELILQPAWMKVKVNGLYGVYELHDRRWILYPMYDFISEDPDNNCIVYRKDDVYKTLTPEPSNDELESIF